MEKQTLHFQQSSWNLKMKLQDFKNMKLKLAKLLTISLFQLKALMIVNMVYTLCKDGDHETWMFKVDVDVKAMQLDKAKMIFYEVGNKLYLTLF